VVKRDPHAVLGVQAGASATQIKAAWRRLARAHHPDLTGDDPAASRVATRQMAEINDAYAALTRTEGSARGRDGRDGDAPFTETSGARRGGPPRPKPSPPVTGRLDTSATYRPRNQVAGNPSRRVPLAGQAPLRGGLVDREPPRASTPTGPPVKGRIRHFRRPTPPSLERAAAHPVEFGKFHGHTLGQIAAFEPSYIDWLAGTVTRDPDLAAAARVIRGDLDRRGVLRRSRPPAERPGRSA
jgi:curved DNA-binding protein CbpA